MIRTSTHAALALFLAGCTATGIGGPRAADARFAPLPEQVVALAAPWQDLASARLRPEDGCYWYEHAGPVETTLLPLRTAEGRPICQAPAE